jgi:hypothetical protein
MPNKDRSEAVTSKVIIAASDIFESVSDCLMLLVIVENRAIPANA